MFDWTIIWIRRNRSLALAILAATTLQVAACESDGTGPGPNSGVSGEWSGVALLGNPRSAQMELTLVDSLVTGTMSLSGSLVDRPLKGKVDDEGHLNWAVPNNCQLFYGLLMLEADGQELNGTIFLEDACGATIVTTPGTLTLERN